MGAVSSAIIAEVILTWKNKGGSNDTETKSLSPLRQDDRVGREAAEKMHVYRDVMYMAICEDFSGHYCAYCQNNESIACDECKLLSDDGCCGGLYRIMDKAQTWSTWVKRARKVREYIEKHG